MKHPRDTHQLCEWAYKMSWRTFWLALLTFVLVVGRYAGVDVGKLLGWPAAAAEVTDDAEIHTQAGADQGRVAVDAERRAGGVGQRGVRILGPALRPERGSNHPEAGEEEDGEEEGLEKTEFKIDARDLLRAQRPHSRPSQGVRPRLFRLSASGRRDRCDLPVWPRARDVVRAAGGLWAASWPASHTGAGHARTTQHRTGTG